MKKYSLQSLIVEGIALVFLLGLAYTVSADEQLHGNAGSGYQQAAGAAAPIDARPGTGQTG